MSRLTRFLFFSTASSVVLASSTTIAHYIRVKYVDHNRFPPQGSFTNVYNHEMHYVLKPEIQPSTNNAIVLISDIGEPSDVFEQLQDDISAISTEQKPVVLRYDRLGYGYSAAPTTPRHVNNLAAELESLLTSLRLLGSGKRLLLVGHGYGALIARIIRDRYGSNITSTVLVSPIHEKMISEEPEFYKGQIVSKLTPLTFTQLITRHGAMEPMLKFIPSITILPLLLSASPKSFDRLKIHLLKNQYYGTCYSELSASLASARQVLASRAKSTATTPIVVVDVNHENEHMIDRTYYKLLELPYNGETKMQWYMKDLLTLSPDSKLITLQEYDHYSVLASKELVSVIIDELKK